MIAKHESQKKGKRCYDAHKTKTTGTREGNRKKSIKLSNFVFLNYTLLQISFLKTALKPEIYDHFVK